MRLAVLFRIAVLDLLQLVMLLRSYQKSVRWTMFVLLESSLVMQLKSCGNAVLLQMAVLDLIQSVMLLCSYRNFVQMAAVLL